ncbi:MAG: DUF4097 family beta strand repeat protein [Candidatus Hydrogenedentes bacterium]|nr:DUF4097 family beta strand repeat protein [Candidatus Hydrogenedentota bacterium]
MFRKVRCGWIVLVLAGVAGAQTAINEIRPATPEIAVEIANVSGSIEVSAWDEASVQITGTLGKGAERLDVSGTDKRLVIKVMLPKNAKNVKSTQLIVKMPKGGAVSATGVGADIATQGVGGSQDLKTMSGNIVASGVANRVKAETVSGHIEVDGRTADIQIKAVSGDVTVRTATVRAEVSTVSGEIEILGENIALLECGAVTGGIRYTGGVTPGGTIEVSTHSGDVSLSLPETTEAEFDLSTFNGGIRCAFGGEVSKPGFGPGASLEHTTGSGTTRIRASAFSGGITVSKL